MNTRKLELEMCGWLSEFDKDRLPPRQGVYLVFGGKMCDTKTADGLREAYIKHLIYIGQSDDIQHRLETHEKTERFEGELKPGETIFYHYIKVNEDAVDDCEGALIRHFKDMPIINQKCKQSFTSKYDNIHIIISGKIPHILEDDKDFIIETNSKK